MGRIALFDTTAIANLLARQNGIITRSQTRTCGMSDAALRHRIREGGAWQVLLPGVHASCTGSATVQQRETAAVLYIAVPDAWWPDAGVVVEIAALVAGSKRGRLDIRALPAR